jgi:hypothetical protein
MNIDGAGLFLTTGGAGLGLNGFRIALAALLETAAGLALGIGLLGLGGEATVGRTFKCELLADGRLCEDG